MQQYAKLLYKTSYKNIEILVLQGDITEEASDAIVNAANEYLAHGGGVAGAIIRKGGYRIQKESDEYISRHGSVKIGEVASTGPGNLRCKFIIHAVGPIYRGGWNNEINDLSKAVNSSIIKANQLRLKSISIPAISSGIFGFPKPLCADVIVKAAKKAIENEKAFTVREIRFINNDFETALLMKNSVNKIFDSVKEMKKSEN